MNTDDAGWRYVEFFAANNPKPARHSNLMSPGPRFLFDATAWVEEAAERTGVGRQALARALALEIHSDDRQNAAAESVQSAQVAPARIPRGGNTTSA